MNLDELSQGLQNIQGAQEAPTNPPVVEAPIDDTAAPWLSMDNLMGSYGNWFGNDKGLGELLLGELRANGVDTQAATEAMLRTVLTGFVNDMNALRDKLSTFIQQLEEQTQQTAKVADAIQSAVDKSGSNIPPISDPTANEPLDLGGSIDVNSIPDMPPGEPDAIGNAGAMPAPDAGMPPMPEQPAPPVPDAGAMPAPDAGMPPMPEQPAPPVPDTTVSDARTKNIKYVLSDASMKKIKSKVSARVAPKPVETPKTTPVSSNILNACLGGF